MRVLITGISGAGKSTLLLELDRRGHRTVATDYDGWELPGAAWDETRMSELLVSHDDVVISGTVENQGRFYDRFDHVVLAADAPIWLTGESHWCHSAEQQAEIRAYVRDAEPLRAGATREPDGRIPVDELADAIEALGSGRLRWRRCSITPVDLLDVSAAAHTR